MQEALKAGHRLTLYVRSPSKLPQDVTNNINVSIVEGDFNNMDAVREALHAGAEVLVSLVGPAIPNKGMVRSFIPSLLLNCWNMQLLMKSTGHHSILRETLSTSFDGQHNQAMLRPVYSFVQSA